MMMAAEKPRKKGKGGVIRVGAGHADEAKQRARVRGNTGDPSFLVPGPDCGIHLPLTNPDTGKPNTYLPSEPWVDFHVRQVDDVGPDGEAIVVRYFDRREKSSPLNGAAPAMVRCSRCGRLCPPQAIEGGECMDHRPEKVHREYGPSPSAAMIRRLRMLNAPRRLKNLPATRVEESPLPSETPADLRAEIRRWEQTGILPE